MKLFKCIVVRKCVLGKENKIWQCFLNKKEEGKEYVYVNFQGVGQLFGGSSLGYVQGFRVERGKCK